LDLEAAVVTMHHRTHVLDRPRVGDRVRLGNGYTILAGKFFRLVLEEPHALQQFKTGSTNMTNPQVEQPVGTRK